MRGQCCAGVDFGGDAEHDFTGEGTFGWLANSAAKFNIVVHGFMESGLEFYNC